MATQRPEELNYRNRNHQLLLYPEDPTHATALVRLKESGYLFAACLHNHDVWLESDEHFDPTKHKAGEPKKDHLHVVLRFRNDRYRDAIAKELGIKPNYIKVCKNLDDRLLYLVHYKNPEKYQYDHEDVFGPLRPSLEKLLDDETEDARCLRIVDLVDAEPGKVSARGLIRKLANNGLYGEARRMGFLLKWLVEEHNDEYHQLGQRNAGVKKDFENFDDFQRGPWKEKTT